MCSASVHIYRLVRNSDSLLLCKAATDLVLRMQGYDHGSVGSGACSFYGGINLCGKLGDTRYAAAVRASEFSGFCLVISCVTGVDGLRLMMGV